MTRLNRSQWSTQADFYGTFESQTEFVVNQDAGSSLTGDLEISFDDLISRIKDNTLGYAASVMYFAVLLHNQFPPTQLIELVEEAHDIAVLEEKLKNYKPLYTTKTEVISMKLIEK